jgi:hypothetical protein
VKLGDALGTIVTYGLGVAVGVGFGVAAGRGKGVCCGVAIAARSEAGADGT